MIELSRLKQVRLNEIAFWEQIGMDPQEFIDKWRVTRRELGVLLDLKEAQIERWFFSRQAKNYQAPKQAHLDRLAEIDLILTMRDTLKSANNSEALQRINNLIPHQND